MVSQDKTLDELRAELIRVEREREIKGPSHPEYKVSGIMIKTLRNAIKEKTPAN